MKRLQKLTLINFNEIIDEVEKHFNKRETTYSPRCKIRTKKIGMCWIGEVDEIIIEEESI